MSYCRWSSDNFNCDLYCYEDINGGWTTHVAGSRYVGDIPKIDYEAPPEVWTQQFRAQHEFLRVTTMEPIGLPYDGQTFNDPTLDEFRLRIVMLKEAGYIVPDHVLEQIDEEIAEEAKEHEGFNQ